jgi:hypothetical protein
MSTNRILLIVGFCFLAGSLMAQGNSPAQSSSAKCPPYADGSLGDPTPLFNGIDLNHDGKLTSEEWKKVEAPESSWQAFMKKPLVQKHGYITLFDFLTDSPPNGVDQGCKGYFTLDDFLATKKMGAPGGAPGGAARQGEAAPRGETSGGAPPQGGSRGGAQSADSKEAKPPSPTAPREALAKGSYSTDGPGKCPPYDDGGIADPTPLVNAIDLNHDGKLTHEEWQKVGAPEPSWNSFMSKPRVKKNGYVTLYDFVFDTPPNGIDTNCDGQFTLDEFLATKNWKMGGGGSGAPGGTPAGAAPQGAPPQGGQAPGQSR